jgi:hypothetical protein
MRVAGEALAGPDEEIASRLHFRVAESEREEVELLLPAQRELKCLEGVELGIGRRPKVDADLASEGSREMLSDRAERELAKRAVSRRPVPRPPRPVERRDLAAARAVEVRRSDRQRLREDVRNPAHRELVLQVVEAVHVLDDQPELAHQDRVLEVLREVRVRLRHEEGIIRRKGGDELRIDREVVGRAVARAAGPAVPVECLLEEQDLALGHEVADRRTNETAIDAMKELGISGGGAAS